MIVDAIEYRFDSLDPDLEIDNGSLAALVANSYRVDFKSCLDNYDPPDLLLELVWESLQWSWQTISSFKDSILF